MKKSQILVGKKYTDGKNSVRKVMAMGPEYVLYHGQQCTDNLRYQLLSKVKGPYAVGEERNSTTTSFAAWAKSEAK